MESPAAIRAVTASRLNYSPHQAMILRQAMPSLSAVIAEPVPTLNDSEPPPAGGVSDERGYGSDLNHAVQRSDSLQAATEFVNRMCQYGTVFFIVDDIQWADQDSINLLDALLANAQGEVGIITVGAPST